MEHLRGEPSVETTQMRTGIRHLDEPEIRVGAFVLKPSYAHEPDRVWIERADGPWTGEGGDFNTAQLEKVLSAFYDEHF